MRTIDIDNPFGGPVFFADVVESTMSEATRFATSGADHGFVICAGSQTRGRGRRKERVWQSESGSNLLFTVALKRSRIDIPARRIPLLTGVAVAKAVENTVCARCEIKWPNDVLVHGKKISGILCEAAGDWIYVGIGVNCNQKKYPRGLRTPATSLSLLAGNDVVTCEILQNLLSALFLGFFDTQWKTEVEARLYNKGRVLRIRIEGGKKTETIRALIFGIDDDGGLILEDSDGVFRTVYGGEVTFNR